MLLDANEEFKAEVLEVFDMFDKEKDETVEVASMGTILRWLKFNPTEKELAKYQLELDPNASGKFRKRDVLQVVNLKMGEPDTIDELVEAMKLFDHDQDGKITVSEFRWFMSKIGDPMEETAVDLIVKEVDPEATGFIDIMSWSKLNFGVKEEKPKEEKKDAKPAAKKKK